MTDFRTHEEMAKVYADLKGQDAAQPYLLEYEGTNQKLIFFGSIHSNNPSDSQWVTLEDAWTRFIAHHNDNKVLIVEQLISDEELQQANRDELLLRHSESGFASWLCAQSSIEIVTGEPSRESEIKYLFKSYPESQIITYYFARQMLQWATQDYRSNPDWQNYANYTIDKYRSLTVWQEEFDLNSVIASYQMTAGKAFDPHDQETLYKLSDPPTSMVSSASGHYRDEYLFSVIQKYWQNGVDIFAVYGSGHAIILEPALRNLTGEKTKLNPNRP